VDRLQQVLVAGAEAGFIGLSTLDDLDFRKISNCLKLLGSESARARTKRK